MAKLAAVEATDENVDKSLPDPSNRAGAVAGIFAILAVLLAAVLNAAGVKTRAFDPSSVEAANLALLAGFYVGAQVVERLAEFVAPQFPPWDVPGDDAAAAAQVKADRAKIMLGVTFFMGVGASLAFGLYFLQAIGMPRPSVTVDAIVTGLTIAGGTKALHEFFSLIQNPTNPQTGTTTT